MTIDVLPTFHSTLQTNEDQPETAQYWYRIKSTDRRANALYDRHYSRIKHNKKVGATNITVGNAIVLTNADYSALWVTIGAMPEVRYDGRAVWNNQVFRNESDVRSSLLITEALRICRWRWTDVPRHGAVTYIDFNETTKHLTEAQKLEHVPGYCYIRAQPRWKHRGLSKSRLHILTLSPTQLARIEPLPPLDFQEDFLAELGFGRPKHYEKQNYVPSGRKPGKRGAANGNEIVEDAGEFDIVQQLFANGLLDVQGIM